MVTIKIYIEGGGEGKDLDIRFREAWTKFFKAAGLSGRLPRPIRGKGRTNTYELFRTAIQHGNPEELPLLLVDSEGPVDANHSVWQHLKIRDAWEKPEQASEKHAYLMVQIMETWFLSDLETLGAYFGHKFKPDKIPQWVDLESVSKQKILDVLEKSSTECGQRRYTKGKISFELLAVIRPESVAARCPHAKAFLGFLADGQYVRH